MLWHDRNIEVDDIGNASFLKPRNENFVSIPSARTVAQHSEAIRANVLRRVAEHRAMNVRSLGLAHPSERAASRVWSTKALRAPPHLGVARARENAPRAAEEGGVGREAELLAKHGVMARTSVAEMLKHDGALVRGAPTSRDSQHPCTATSAISRSDKPLRTNCE